MHLLPGPALHRKEPPVLRISCSTRRRSPDIRVARAITGGTAAESPSQEQLGRLRSCGTVRPRNTGSIGPHNGFCAPLFAARSRRCAHMDRHLCAVVRRLHVLVQPQAEASFTHAGSKCRTLTRRQTLFSLPAGAGPAFFRRHKAQRSRNIFRRRFYDAARRGMCSIRKEFAHRVEQTLAQTVDVRPA